ncbi:cobalamin-independent methionine synthase II family protein [archaeon]|nr:cobalamin-independent methionine synthase II family protein [archaeon]MBT6698655.1 cobalamin-independent methionine synthase II family protein [archaeon]
MGKIKTTVIGSYPKPAYVEIPDWFKLGFATYTTKDSNAYLKNKDQDDDFHLLKGIKEVLQEQEKIGIDIPTDGEIRRGNYIHYHCRHLKGISFDKLTKKVCRNGAYTFMAPTVIGKIESIKPFLANEWKLCTLFTNNQIKVTIPGPMTIFDTISSEYYKDEKELYDDIVKAINHEVLSLAEQGCVHIQIDEPLLVRKPKDALDFGIKNLERCFAGVPSTVFKTIHACCGYPNKLDEKDYPKADKDAYLKVAKALDDADIDAISLEDCHRRNDPELFSKFTKTTIILGVLKIASSKIETVEEIKNHIEEVLQNIPAERLMIAPDCGLAMLPIEICKAKLKNMVKAVELVNQQI